MLSRCIQNLPSSYRQTAAILVLVLINSCLGWCRCLQPVFSPGSLALALSSQCDHTLLRLSVKGSTGFPYHPACKPELLSPSDACLKGCVSSVPSLLRAPGSILSILFLFSQVPLARGLCISCPRPSYVIGKSSTILCPSYSLLLSVPRTLCCHIVFQGFEYLSLY
jgi:hypothetical protein